MIDTLKLGFRSEYCKVEKSSDIDTDPPSQKLTGEKREGMALFRTAKGWQSGKKAHINTDKFNLTFHPILYEPYGFVQFSIPKVLYGQNFGKVTQQGLNSAIECVESELYDHGVCISLFKDSYISRIDLFKDAETERPFVEYAPLFDLLELPRMSRRAYGGSTFLFENGVEELCIYDKYKELKAKARKAGETIPEFTGNRIRCESRFKDKRKSEAVLKVTNPKELLRDFDYLKDLYNSKIEKYIFDKDIAALPLPLEIEPNNSIRNTKQDYDNRLLKSYIALHGDQKPYLDKVRLFAERTSYSRTAKEIRMTSEASGEVESRYIELKSKLLR